MQIYKMPDDYSFMYWSTPVEELTRMNEISAKRAIDWNIENGGAIGMEKVSAVIPSQFFAVMSIQTAQAIEILINDYNANFETIAGIYVQRITEVEAGPEILMLHGFVFGDTKYAITPIQYEDKMHKECGAILLGNHNLEEIGKEAKDPQLLH